MNNTTLEPLAPFICVSLSALDTLISAGDPPYVLTVYSHIIRRAGYNGMCWESVTNMAKYLRISTGSTKKALQLLGDHGLITRESRVGTTSIYRVNNPVTVGVDHNTVEVDHNNPVTVGVDHNNLVHHMVRVDHNNVDHNNLVHHMVRGSHHMTRGNHHMVKDGSPYDHKLDPYKLDPYELDQNKLKNHDHESDRFFSDDQEQNPSSEASEALDQKPQPKIMPKPKPKLKDHPSDRIESPIQIDQNPHDPHGKPDTPCPECDRLTNKFQIHRYGSCSDCWVKSIRK